MQYFLGIDAGTSGIKAVVIAENGEIVSSGYQECDVISPEPGWAEQNPLDWWDACQKAIKKATSGCDRPENIAAISFSGQQQGNVMMDAGGNPIGNCMIWLDQRAVEEVKEIESMVSEDEVLRITTNHCLNSFWAPKLLWLKKHRPEVLERTKKVLFTKDYLRYMMTGEYATELSDASLTFLVDVPNRCWSDTMIRKIGIPKEILPERLTESGEVVGMLKKELAEDWGMKPGIPVAAGAGDQPACGVGTGIIRNGTIGSSIGTSGVVFGCTDKPFIIRKNSGTFSMCHAIGGKWCFLGLSLTCGGSFKWMRDHLFADRKAEFAAQNKDIYDYMTDLAGQAPAGSEGLIFLPYLNGDKTPNNDENARAVFFGLSQRHGIQAMCRSVMEGATYSLRDTVELFRECGLKVNEIVASGGGAKSQLWRQIQADIYNAKVITTNMEEGPAAGAAILAAVAAKAFGSVEEACSSIIKVTSVTEPIARNVGIYEDYYRIYHALYGNLKDSFAKREQIVEKYL